MKALRRRFLALMVLTAYLVLAGSGAMAAGSCCVLRTCEHRAQHFSAHLNSEQGHCSASNAMTREQPSKHLCHAVHHQSATGDALTWCPQQCACVILPSEARSYIHSSGTKHVLAGTDEFAPVTLAPDPELHAETSWRGDPSSLKPSFLGSALGRLRTIVLLI